MLYWILIISGIIFVIMSIYKIYLHIKRSRCTCETEGILIYADERGEYDPSLKKYVSYYVPVFEYKIEGQIYKTEAPEYSRDASDFPLRSIGRVEYNPDDPRECFINGKKGKVLFSYNEGDEIRV